MTPVSKNLCIDKLDYIVNKYNNACPSIIKVKPVEVKSNTYIDSSKEINDKDPKFKIGGIVRISKFKNIFAKAYTPNWSEEVLRLQKLKIMCRGYILLMILADKKLFEPFMETNCKTDLKNATGADTLDFAKKLI